MKVAALVASPALILLICGEALALKDLVHVTPRNQQSLGFAVESNQRKDGTVQFTIIRDLSKVRSHAPASKLEVRRSATLKIYGDSGLIAECKVEPEKKQQTIICQFLIARDRIPDSHFTVAEIDDYKNNEGSVHLLGGGTLFEIRLADFLAK
jgi:hypothetical protein